MDFVHPLVLLALVPLAWATYTVGRGRLRRLPWLRALVTLVLRLSIGALLVIALAGPRATLAAGGVNVVFVLDRSASVGPAAQRMATSWIAAALRGLHGDDSASVVSFGATAAWSGRIEDGKLPVFPDVGKDGTDIEAALRLALGTLPPDRPSRLVLLSDGRQTAGDALQVAQQAASLGVPISVVSLPAPPSNDVALVALDVPHYSRGGEHITLRVTVQAPRAERVQLRLTVDGVPAGEQVLAVPAGTSTFFFAQTVPAHPGIERYRVRVLAPDDTVPQNDVLDAATVVQPTPRVLVLAGNPAEAKPLVATLAHANMRVRMLPATQAPTDAAGLGAYDAVVLADVPASSLAPRTVAVLTTLVHDRGRGLLVTGGPHSFASGGYPASGLENLLPVTSVAQAHSGRGNAGLILLIDKSGSMMDDVRGVSKISMAQQAAIDAIAHLQPNDQFGVLAFDDTTHTVVPFGPVGSRKDQEQTRADILALQPFGDTVIYPAMREAARLLFNSKAPFKHVVLMTDGQGENAKYAQLIKQMRQNNITLSTIGIGSDAEVDELRAWAAAGGGRFYYTADPHDIPRLVVLETRISSGPTVVQGTVGVHQAADAPALRSLAGTALPTLHTYNITAPRGSAQVVLQSGLGDPLLSQWQYGLGRVAVWTGGTSADWARSWLARRDFWSDTLRWTMGDAEPPFLQPELALAHGMLQIGANAVTGQGDFANLLPTRALVTMPDGRSRSVLLFQDAPGHYSATLPAPEVGVYQAQLAQYDGSQVLHQSAAALAVPYPAEYLPGGPDRDLLATIAATGNAPDLQQPSDAFSAAGLPPKPMRREIWPFLALLALLLFPIDVGVRVLYTPPAPYDPARYRN